MTMSREDRAEQWERRRQRQEVRLFAAAVALAALGLAAYLAVRWVRREAWADDAEEPPTGGAPLLLAAAEEEAGVVTVRPGQRPVMPSDAATGALAVSARDPAATRWCAMAARRPGWHVLLGVDRLGLKDAVARCRRALPARVHVVYPSRALRDAYESPAESARADSLVLPPLAVARVSLPPGPGSAPRPAVVALLDEDDALRARLQRRLPYAAVVAAREASPEDWGRARAALQARCPRDGAWPSEAMGALVTPGVAVVARDCPATRDALGPSGAILLGAGDGDAETLAVLARLLHDDAFYEQRLVAARARADAYREARAAALAQYERRVRRLLAG